MYRRFIASVATCAILFMSIAAPVSVRGQQGTSAQQSGSDTPPLQRLEVMRSRLEAMRRSLNGALAGFNAQDKNEKSSDDPRERLRGMEKEVSSVLSDVNIIIGKLQHSERVETERIDKLETSTNDLDTRVQAALRETAGQRSAATAATGTETGIKRGKKKKKFLIFGGGDDDKYEELTSTIAPGRDRVLFEEAAHEVRKGRYEVGRYLFNTIITAYPDSQYLPMAKLAIADSFYLEGTTSALIQAAASYQDWLTFFPTHPLSDDAMLKVAEAEMRQMGLADRDVSHARKAEQRLKALLQQFPNTNLRTDVELRLREVQDNLAMHNLQVARFYLDARYKGGKGGLKGAQSRLREIVEKYPNFTWMSEVLFRYAYTYQQEEETDEAAKYYQRIVRDFPNSEYVEKAKEQLQIIGAPIPDPDPIKAKIPEPEKPGMMSKLFTEVTGYANVTVDKNGVLVKKDKAKEDRDLLDEVIANQGVLPDNAMPVTAPLNRRPPAPPKPKPTTGTGISVTSQPSGAPQSPANPASTTTQPAGTTGSGTKP
ncbi:MAG: outer membrane protein assembly factor BamD [Pyrinomonadaceae bacterium]|nr:outer membrane protein assembly factor BamD [Pyrinomonadaceae bacterium]